jgi:hypothetical protein
MPKILISYRRSDTDAIAGRIHDRLSAYYGEESVFMDIDSIPFATDFRDHIRDALRQTDIMLAIVGPQWLGRQDAGQYRIRDETDPVRIEIEAALKYGVPVMPVLVSGARMPQPSELPASLEKFSYLNAPSVDSGRDFRQHMDRVMRSIDQQFGFERNAVAPPAPKRAWTKVAAATAFVGLVVAAIIVWQSPKVETKSAATVSAPPATARPAAPTGTDIVVDLSQVDTGGKTVAARPYLKDYGISVADVVPPTAGIIVANNRAIYDGAAIRPTVSQNFLMQVETGNGPASYTLRFDRPVDTFKFVRPQLFRDTDSGITHPAWTATALDANGRPLSSQSEVLLRSHAVRVGDTSAQTYVLRSPGFEPIAAVRFESDPRLDGKPFAAFSALVIEQITLVRLKPEAKNAP